MAWSPIVGPLILVCLVCFGLYWRWTDVEHWLKGVICRGMSNALNVDVSMGTLQIRWLSDGRIRVYVSGLVVGCYRRADFSAPYFAAVGRLEVTTAGIFGLLSLPGVFLIGTHENEFCLGFATRQVDTMELSCVSVFIEQAPDRETGVNVHTNAFLEDMRRAEKKGAADKQAEQERYLRHWHRKWADPEHSSDDDTNSDSDSDSDGFNSTATEAGSEPELSSDLLSPESADGTTRGSRPSSRSGSPSGQHLSPPDDTKRARSPSPKRRNRLVRMVKKKAHAVVDTVKHRKAKHKAVTAENRENVAIASLLSELKTAKKRFHKSQMWRIGRLHIHDCAINRYGKDLRLGTEGWVLTAFIGSQKHLKKTIGSGVSKVAHPLRQLVHQKIFHKSAKSPDLPRACWAPSQSAPGADSP